MQTPEVTAELESYWRTPLAGRDQPTLNVTVQRGSLALKRALGSLPMPGTLKESRGASVRYGVYTLCCRNRLRISATPPRGQSSSEKRLV